MFGNAVVSGLLLELGLSQLHLTEVLIPVKPEPWNFAPVRQEKEEDSRREREKEIKKEAGGKIFKKSHKGILSGKLKDRSTCLPIPDAVLSSRSLNSFLELYNNLDND